MNFNPKIFSTIPLLLTVAFSSFAQYQQNDSSLIQKSKVKSLIVFTDSLQDGCPVDFFEYNTLGNITQYRLGITSDHEYFNYNEKYQLTQHISGFKDDGEELLDTTSVTVYYYNKDQFNYSETKYQNHSKKISKSKPVFFQIEIDSAIYLNKKLLSHIVDTFYRPCLGEWTGKHRIENYYLKNGLIRKVKIIPLTSSGRKNEWFFFYEYYE